MFIVRQCKADTMLAELTRSGTAGLAPSLTVSPPDLYDCLALPCWSPLGLRWSPGTTWYNEVLKVVILCKFCRCNMCMKLYECVWYFSCSSVVIAVQTYSMQGNTCTSMSNFRLAPALKLIQTSKRPGAKADLPPSLYQRSHAWTQALLDCDGLLAHIWTKLCNCTLCIVLCFADGDDGSKPAKIPLVEKVMVDLFALAEKFEAEALSNVTLVK